MSDKPEVNTSKDQLDAFLEADQRQIEADQRQQESASSRTDILLKEFSEAGKRTRLSLITLSIASILLFIGVFNNQWSWLATKEVRQHDIMWPDDLKDPINPANYVNNDEAIIAAINRLSENNRPQYPRELIHQLLDVEMKTIEVPILGIQIYIEDMPILGGIGISFLLLWLYFVGRRERSIVKMLHSISTFAKPDEKKYQIKKIYTALAFSQVFNTIPYIDAITKSKPRKKVSDFFQKNFNINWNASNLFSYLMPFIPCFVIFFLLYIDYKETFCVTSGQRLIPNVNYFKADTSFSKRDLESQTKFADMCVENKQMAALGDFKKKVMEIRQDSLIKYYEKGNLIKAEAKKYDKTVKDFKESIYSHATTIDFYRYRAYQFKDFLHDNPRLPWNWNLVHEIIWFRTVLPWTILLMNLIIAIHTVSMGRSRDFHMKGIFIQYEKYYPKNYNIYNLEYAYVSILLQNEKGDALPNVTINAVNNYRTCKTNKQGFARLIELQESIATEQKETFEFVLTRGGRVACSDLVKLEKIERCDSDEDNNKTKTQTKDSEMHQNNNVDKKLFLKNKITQIMMGSNKVRIIDNKKSVQGNNKSLLGWSWPWRDHRNKPISAANNMPISRLAATKQLIKGEMLIHYIMKSNTNNPPETIIEKNCQLILI